MKNLLLAILIFFCAVLVQGQPVDLFDGVGPDELSGSPPPGIAAVYPLTLSGTLVETLATAPAQVKIELPSVGTVTADLTYFEPREGFDADDNPLPGADLAFLWRGKAGNIDVVMTVVGNNFCSSFVGPEGNFSVSKYEGSEEKKLIHLAAEPPVPLEPPVPPPPLFYKAPTFDELLETHRDTLSPAVYEAFKKGSILPETIIIDVLVVFTEQARIDAGGAPGNTSDNTDVRCEIYNANDNLNAAYANSEMNAASRIVDTQRLPEFSPNSDSLLTLGNIKNHPTIQEWRESANADIVSVTIRDTSSPDVSDCGYAYVQRSECGDTGPIEKCDIGEAFRPYAYNWSAINCVKNYNVFAHEIGHNLGAEHEPEHALLYLPRERASFNFSFGHKVSGVIDFRTMMTILPGGEKILNFSSPAVEIGGYATGITNDRHNARTIELLAALVASFYQPRPDFISGDNFKYGDLSAWSPGQSLKKARNE